MCIVTNIQTPSSGEHLFIFCNQISFLECTPLPVNVFLFLFCIFILCRINHNFKRGSNIAKSIDIKHIYLLHDRLNVYRNIKSMLEHITIILSTIIGTIQFIFGFYWWITSSCKWSTSDLGTNPRHKP